MTPETRRAYFASLRYVALAMLTYVAGWVDQVGDAAIASIKWNQWTTLSIGVLTSGLVALGAILNQTWGQAENGNHSPGTASHPPHK